MPFGGAVGASGFVLGRLVGGGGDAEGDRESESDTCLVGAGCPFVSSCARL